MTRKYFLVLGENIALGLKFIVGEEKVVLGGSIRMERTIVNVIFGYFGEETQFETHYYGTTYKIRFTFRCSSAAMYAAMRKMEADGIQVVQTNKHGRVMR